MRKRKTLGKGRKRLLLLGEHLIVFGFHFGDDSISKEVARLLLFMVSPRKNTVHCLLCLIVVLVFLSVKDPDIRLA